MEEQLNLYNSFINSPLVHSYTHSNKLNGNMILPFLMHDLPWLPLWKPSLHWHLYPPTLFTHTSCKSQSCSLVVHSSTSICTKREHGKNKIQANCFSEEETQYTTYGDQNSWDNHVCYDENEHIFDSHQLSFSLYPVWTALITASLQNTICCVRQRL